MSILMDYREGLLQRVCVHYHERIRIASLSDGGFVVEFKDAAGTEIVIYIDAADARELRDQLTAVLPASNPPMPEEERLQEATSDVR